MSMYRTIARIAAVSAINNFMQEPWPTLAGPNIFDSKIEPVEDMALDRVFPCVVVYTDYDKDHWSKGDGFSRDRMLNLTFELLVVMTTKVDGSGSLQEYTIDCPLTDSEIETSLDALETQVFRALAQGNEGSDAFNYICPTYDAITSRRGASVEGGNRLAARQITLEMKGARENYSGVIPDTIEAFLSKLEQGGDYAERVPEIRQLLTWGADLTPGARLMQTFGYSRDVGDRLGSPQSVVNLASPIVYNIGGLNS